MTAGVLLAQFEFASLQDWFFFAARLVVAILVGLVGWFFAAPLSYVLYGMAFHRPLPRPTQFLVRAGAAMLLGLLTFLFFPIGFGGGFGTGFGSGWGTGTGAGGDGTGEKDGKSTVAGKNAGKAGGSEAPTAALPVELVVSKQYEPGSGRYYLINAAPPAKTLNEVKAYLQEHRGRYGRVEIHIYANSVSSEHPATQALKDLTGALQLGYSVPTEYRTRIRTGTGSPPPAQAPGG